MLSARRESIGEESTERTSSMSEQTKTPIPPADVAAQPSAHRVHQHEPGRRLLFIGIAVVIAIAVLIVAIPIIIAALNTVSTDDAYVNGHATFVAPRVGGQVTQVLVDDNNRVHQGDLIVKLDTAPYQDEVNIRQAAVDSAAADLETTTAVVRSNEALARSLRWKLEHAMEDVKDKIATLETAAAALDSAQAVAKRARADLDRAVPLAKNGAVSSEELDRRTQVVAVADAQVKEAMQGVYQIRASLGLDKQPETGGLASVPDNLVETFSSVRQAQYELMQAAAQLGVVYPFEKSPTQMLNDFKKRDPDGDIDKIYAKILKEAPAIRQAEAKVAQVKKDLDLAQLNLKYCNVYAEIDGVVTRRNVNPGNNVVSGQELMVIRSLKEIWIDANFKETELAELRIGQPVDLRLDMYGKKKTFKGRISGFTMGTGSTLALLPAQNATGNFVKVVQRLPVRIDLENYDPETDPLFVGLSVGPSVHINQPATGRDAGKLLQPYIISRAAPTTSPSNLPTTEIGDGGK
jgi:membrane fusion protein (multidrug efflux system)